MAEIDTSTEAVETLLNGVTEGPWHISIDDDGNPLSGRPSVQAPEELDCAIVHWDGFVQRFWRSARGDREIHANARFIAASRELVPALLAERDQLRDELDAAYAIIAEARAGAIEAAASGIVNLPLPYERWSDGQCGAVLVALQKHADSIRAIHDTDTQAAIERIKERARQEERERCARIAEGFGCCHVSAEIATSIRKGE